MSLSIDFLGFRLRNPLMLSEGPLSGNFELLNRVSEYSIGLIFTKGIRLKAVNSPVPFIRKYERSIINADWSCIGLNEWLNVIRKLDINMPLVTSVAKNYVKPDTAVDMAVELVKAGSRAVSFVDYNPNELIKTVRLARPELKVPIMAKLPPFIHDLERVLKDLVNAGIDAVVAMDSIGPVLSIDTETGEPVLGSGDGAGYLSGRYILPVTLKYIYEISRLVNVPVVGVGGVTDYRSVVQMIMAGATGVGMVSEPLLKGPGIFNKVEKDLESYLREENIGNIAELRGITHKIVEERKVSTVIRASIDPDICTLCGACEKVCYPGAISKSLKSYTVNRDFCTGCGLCGSVCPVNAVIFK